MEEQKPKQPYTLMHKIGIGSVCLLVVFLVWVIFNLNGCEGTKPEPPKVNVKAVHDYSDSVVKLASTLNYVRDSLRTSRELIRIQAGVIASKTKQVARVKDLEANLLLPVPDSSKPERFNEKAIDSLVIAAKTKEDLLDSANKRLSETFKSIDQSDSLENKKDSLTHGLIVKLNDDIDSQGEEIKKLTKKANRKFSVGPNVGVGISPEGKAYPYLGIGVSYKLISF